VEVMVTGILHDEGSVVVFQGVPLDESAPGLISFAVDHRPAQELVNGMLNEEEVIAIVEPWQVLRQSR